MQPDEIAKTGAAQVRRLVRLLLGVVERARAPLERERVAESALGEMPVKTIAPSAAAIERAAKIEEDGVELRDHERETITAVASS